MGFDFFNQPIENLDEAEKILKSFREVSEAELLLDKIKQLQEKTK